MEWQEGRTERENTVYKTQYNCFKLIENSKSKLNMNKIKRGKSINKKLKTKSAIRTI